MVVATAAAVVVLGFGVPAAQSNARRAALFGSRSMPRRRYAFRYRSGSSCRSSSSSSIAAAAAAAVVVVVVVGVVICSRSSSRSRNSSGSRSRRCRSSNSSGSSNSSSSSSIRIRSFGGAVECSAGGAFWVKVDASSQVLPLGLYKIFFYLKPFVHEAIVLSFHPPTSIPHAVAILLQSIGQYTTPPLDVPFVCYTAYNIGNKNIVSRSNYHY